MGALQTGKPPVVNADRLDGLDNSDFQGVGEVVVFETGAWLESDPGSVTFRYLGEITAIDRQSGGTDDVFLTLDGPGTNAGITYGSSHGRGPARCRSGT